jgi:hypothetical protein
MTGLTINGIQINCTHPQPPDSDGGRGGMKRSADSALTSQEGSAEEVAIEPGRVTNLTNESCGTGFACCPTDLLTHIFENFSGIGDMFKVCLVNRHWNDANSRTPTARSLWRERFVAWFPHIKIQPTTDCKALYKERMEIQRAFKEGRSKQISLPRHERGRYVSDDLFCLENKCLITLWDLKEDKGSDFTTSEDSQVLIVKNNYLCMVTKKKEVYIRNLKIGKWLKLKMAYDFTDLVSSKGLNDITDNNFLCIKGLSPEVKVFDLENWNPRPLFHYPADEAIRAGTPPQIDSLLGEGNHLYIVDSVREVLDNRPTGFLSYRVSAWEPATRSLLYMAHLDRSPPSCIKATDDLLLLGFHHGKIAAIDRHEGTVKYSWIKVGETTAQILDICVQGALLYAGAEGGEIVICDLMTGKRLYQLCPPIERTCPGRIFNKIDVQDDIIIAGSVGGTVTIWDSKSRKRLGVIGPRTQDGADGAIGDLKIENNRIYARTWNKKIVVLEFQRQNTSSQGDETPSKK